MFLIVILNELETEQTCLRRSLPLVCGHTHEYEGSHNITSYGRKVLQADPNQDSISANCTDCLENERMIVAKETVWARCREEMNTLLDLLPPGLKKRADNV